MEQRPDDSDKLRALLEEAKRVFRTKVLKNNVILAAVEQALIEAAEKVKGTSVEDFQLPDFSLEPWRPASQDETKQKLGLLITQSVGVGGEVPGLTISFGLFEYVDIAEFDFLTREVSISDGLKSRASSQEEGLVAYEAFMDAYREFIEACKELDAVIDPIKGTFEIDVPYYQEDVGERQFADQPDPKDDNFQERLKNWEWRGNIPTDPDDERFPNGLDVLDRLREEHGSENVLAIRPSYNPATDQIEIQRGTLGIWVRK
jgi:hypothetical protein